VNPGDTVFLGSGTTVLEVARCLLDHQELTVITNSLPVINTMIGQPGMKLIIIGGILRDSELYFLGHLTEQALSEVRADKVIMGARAISLENGLTNDYLNETLTDRAIIKSSERVILVVDHTKCGSVSTAFLAPLSDIDTLVTDSNTDPDFIQSLNEMGIHVISV
jgi:DeoR/GlpR family transcriptional regulator of sugar metabolism